VKYRIGQRIYIKAKGLYLGNYVSGSNTGYYQIGAYVNKNGGMEYLSSAEESQHVFRSGVPETPPAPKVITKQNDFDIPKDYHTLVKLQNCYFVNADGTTKYFETTGSSTTISRRIKFNLGGGNGVDPGISPNIKKNKDILPVGALNITGILTKFYDDTPQLIICSVGDVQIIPPAKDLLTFDMNTNPFDKSWTNKHVKGSTAWTYNANTKNVSIQAPAGEETECWFVSPKLNFSGEKDVALLFTYRIPNGKSDNVAVKYTVDGTNWNALDFTPAIGATSDAALKLNDNIATNPNLQIAFQYKTTELYPTWIISKITFKANVVM
jgi:hypothetical protein